MSDEITELAWRLASDRRIGTRVLWRLAKDIEAESYRMNRQNGACDPVIAELRTILAGAFRLRTETDEESRPPALSDKASRPGPDPGQTDESSGR